MGVDCLWPWCCAFSKLSGEMSGFQEIEAAFWAGAKDEIKLKKQLSSSALLSPFADSSIWLVLEYILVNVL